MKRVALDTSAYSYLMKGNTRVAQLLNEADEVLVPAVVIGELLAGFKRGSAEQRNKAILDEFLATSTVSTCSLDEGTAERYAVILNHLRTQGTPIPTNDIWIASCAMQHGLTLISGERHFLSVPQILCKIVDH